MKGFIVFIAGVIFSSALYGHGGGDFLKIEASTLLKQKKIEFSTLIESRENLTHEIVFEPSLSYGLMNNVMLEVHMHSLSKSSESFNLDGYGLKASTVLFRYFLNGIFHLEIERREVLTTSHSSATFGSAVNGISSKQRSHAAHFTNTNTTVFTSSKRGENVPIGTFVFAKELGVHKVQTQIQMEWFDSDHNESYGIGYRYGRQCWFGVSAELLGPIWNDHGHELWLTGHFEVWNHCELSLGLGQGIGAASDLSAVSVQISKTF